jgi:hypothetical protein
VPEQPGAKRPVEFGDGAQQSSQQADLGADQVGEDRGRVRRGLWGRRAAVRGTRRGCGRRGRSAAGRRRPGAVAFGLSGLTDLAHGQVAGAAAS